MSEKGKTRKRSSRAASEFAPKMKDEFGSYMEADTDAVPEIKRKGSLELPSPYPQLTIKALIGGSLIGVVCSFLALYYGLKVGVTPSLNILSGLGGFVMLKSGMWVAGKITGYKGVFTPQENAVVQTVSVAVLGTSAPSFGFASSYLAMRKETCNIVQYPGDNCETDVLPYSFVRDVVWCLALSFFGLFIAFGLREYVVLKMRLLFPSGTVTSYVIKAMHSSSKVARSNFQLLSKFFSISFLASMFQWYFGLTSFPFLGTSAKKLGWAFDADLGTICLSMLVSYQVTWSISAGMVVSNGLVRPLLRAYADGPTDQGYWYDSTKSKSEFVQDQAYTIFAGLGFLLSQGLISVVMLLWMIFFQKKEDQEDSFADEKESFEERKKVILDDIFTKTAVPFWVSPVGYVVSGAIAIVMLHFWFHTQWYQLLIALIIIPLFTVSNIQGIGRTDWDVSSAYGKLVMFPFGLWNRGGSVVPSLVLSTFTVSGCSNAGELTQSFRTGYLLGASPMHMFIAQNVGQFVGAVVTPSLFLLLSASFKIPNEADDAFIPARYGPIYRVLANITARKDMSLMPKYVLWFLVATVCISFVMTAIMLIIPKRFRYYFPDLTAFAIGLVIPAFSSFDFFIGGLIKLFWMSQDPKGCEKQTPYIVSGALCGAGVSIVLQCLVSLGNLRSPLKASFSQEPLKITWFLIVCAVLLGICVFMILVCGAYYWFPYLLTEDDETDKTRETTPKIDTERGIEMENVEELTKHPKKSFAENEAPKN